MNVQPRMFAFEGINFDTPEGIRLKAYLEERRDLLRRQNDNKELSERETAAIRGAIGEITMMLGGSKPVVKLPQYSNPHHRDRG